jgi:hypothetical protein
MRVPAYRSLERILCFALAVLTGFSPFLRPTPARAAQPALLLPASLFNTSSFSAEQIYATSGGQRAALLNLQQRAIMNTLTAHGLPAADFDAAQTWGRSDALFELWLLLVTAINTAACAPGQTPGDQCRTVDQQNAVDWFAAVAQRKAVKAAAGAGLQYVKWAGLNRDTYQSLIDGNASQSQLENYLYQGFLSPKNYGRGFATGCPLGEQCVTWQGIAYTEGFCVYRPPSPFQDDYSDRNNISCTTPCRSPAGCNPFGPSYDDLVNWGVAELDRKLFDNPGFALAMRDVAIGAGFGIGAAAVVTGLSLLATAVGSYTGAAFAGASFIFPAAVGVGVTLAGVAALVLIAVVAAIVAGVYAVNFFNAEQVPRQLAAFIAGAASTPIDLKGMLADPDKMRGLFALFIGATEPGPKPGVCSGVGVDGKPCLNAPPIPGASPQNDPVFAVAASSPRSRRRRATRSHTPSPWAATTTWQ